MKKKIKTKSNNIRTKKLDSKQIYTQNMKNRLINRIELSKNTEEKEESNEINYASNKIFEVGKDTNIFMLRSLKNTTNRTYENIKGHRNKLREKDLVIPKQVKRKYSINTLIKKRKNNKTRLLTSQANEIINRAKKYTAYFIKKLIKSFKNLTVILASVGSLAIMIIIIAVIVAGMFGSAFGLLFSNETPETEENMSIKSAINFLDEEIEKEISEIKTSTNYDSIRIENRSIIWREILSVYAVITTNREVEFNIMNMDKSNYNKLKEIFWNVVEVNHYTEKYTVRVVTTNKDGNKVTKSKIKTRLIIDVECLSLEEIMELYKMNKSERKQVYEMMNEQYDEMWEEILE